jgi:hypothetical protein
VAWLSAWIDNMLNVRCGPLGDGRGLNLELVFTEVNLHSAP